MARRDVIKYELLGGYRMKVWFKDGQSGEVDIAKLTLFEGYYFSPLKDADYFRQVTINEELGTLHWPNDAEIDPYILYSKATGEPLKIKVWHEEVIEV